MRGQHLLRKGCTIGTLLAFLVLAAPVRADLIVGSHSSLEPSDFTLNGTAWNPGPNAGRAAGNPAAGAATWSIMGAGFVDASGFETAHSGTTVPITTLAVPGYALADYEALFDTVLDVWDAASGFTNLGQVADGGVNAGASQASGGHLGDIRIAAWEITTAGVLAHAFQPGTEALFGPGGTIAGDVHIDLSWTWVDDPTDTTADSDIDLFTVLLHEFGHALGLGHSSVSGSVMESMYAGARRTLHADDIAGIQAIYGAEASAVPEPASLLLLSIGGIFAWGVARRRVKDLAA